MGPERGDGAGAVPRLLPRARYHDCSPAPVPALLEEEPPLDGIGTGAERPLLPAPVPALLERSYGGEQRTAGSGERRKAGSVERRTAGSVERRTAEKTKTELCFSNWRTNL